MLNNFIFIALIKCALKKLEKSYLKTSSIHCKLNYTKVFLSKVLLREQDKNVSASAKSKSF
jgi:hypothetical protein